MIKWLYEKLIGWPVCEHVWATEREISVYSEFNTSIPVHIDYHLVCTKCGDRKKRRF